MATRLKWLCAAAVLCAVSVFGGCAGTTGKDPATRIDVEAELAEWRAFEPIYPDAGVDMDWLRPRRVKMRNLARMGSDGAPVLRAMLVSGDPDLEEAALWTIWEIMYPNVPPDAQFDMAVIDCLPVEPVEWLGDMLLDAYLEIRPARQDDVYSLAKRHVFPSMRFLSVASSSSEWLVRRDSMFDIGLLCRTERAKALGILRQGMADKWADVRSNAIMGAMLLNANELVPDIVRLLDDGEWASGVAFLYDDDGFLAGNRIPTDEEVAEIPGGMDRKLEVRHIAAYAVQALTGKDYGFRSVFWSYDDMPRIVARIRADFPEASRP